MSNTANTTVLFLLVSFLSVGCSAQADHGIHSEVAAHQACVDDCERIQNECHLPGYPSGGRTCEQACEGLTYVSPVDPTRFCMEDIEIDHFVACESCLFGDTSDGMCDFSTQFDPAGRCYDVCQPNRDDVEFCGHVAIVGDMSYEGPGGFVGCSDAHLTQIAWTVSDRSGSILSSGTANCGPTLTIGLGASWPTDLVVRVQGHSDLGNWNQACSATGTAGSHFSCQVHYSL